MTPSQTLARFPWMGNPTNLGQLRKLRDQKIDPICPECGEFANRFWNQWGVEHRCCGLRSLGYKPLATEATLAARLAAHNSFDRIWKHRHMARSMAYVWLSEAIGVPVARCHMSLMSESEAVAAGGAAIEYIREVNGG